MENKRIWLSSPHMGHQELEFVQDAFATNWIAPLGPHVDGFEQDIASFTGVSHVAALSSGTSALHLAMILLGVGAGDEVICQSFTFSASANPIVYQGSTPVFIDSETETWNMDPGLLEHAILERQKMGKNIKAIVPVHLYGVPAKMDEIISVSQKYNIPIIEDAAEALGSMYRGKACGSMGNLGVLSFNGNKIITTSGGGALIGEDKMLIDQARFLATQARDQAPHYQHSHIGYNYRLSNVCAGIGRGQMINLPHRIAQRRSNFEFYKTNLEGIKGISFLNEPENTFSNRWLTCILINTQLTGGKSREDVRLHLNQFNIESRPLWKPMHLQPVFENQPYYGNGISDQLFEQGLCIPSGSNLTEEDLNRVLTAILEVLN